MSLLQYVHLKALVSHTTLYLISNCIAHLGLLCSFANDQQMRCFWPCYFGKQPVMSKHMAKQQATELCAAVPVPPIASR